MSERLKPERSMQVPVDLHRTVQYMAYAAALCDVLPERFPGLWSHVAYGLLVRTCGSFLLHAPNGIDSDAAHFAIEEWAGWSGRPNDFANVFITHWAASTDEGTLVLRAWDWIVVDSR